MAGSNRIQDGKDFAIGFGGIAASAIYVAAEFLSGSWIEHHTAISMVIAAIIGSLIGWFVGISLPPDEAGKE